MNGGIIRGQVRRNQRIACGHSVNANPKNDFARRGQFPERTQFRPPRWNNHGPGHDGIQGGTTGGCAIPAGATAVEASVSAVTPSASGFSRAWPAGTAQPTPGPLDPSRIRTNFVLFRVDRDRQAFLEALEARDVHMVPYARGQVRAVTHYGITPDDIDRAIAAVSEALHETERTATVAAAATA